MDGHSASPGSNGSKNVFARSATTSSAGLATAVHGLGERFDVNSMTGTTQFTVPIHTSPGRDGFGPDLALTHSQGNGNGAFGRGWALDLPRIYRRREKGIPTYDDAVDVFIYSDGDDLVPKLDGLGQHISKIENGVVYREYILRRAHEPIRIEQLVEAESGNMSWRVITADNVTETYGCMPSSQIYDETHYRSHGTRRSFA